MRSFFRSDKNKSAKRSSNISRQHLKLAAGDVQNIEFRYILFCHIYISILKVIHLYFYFLCIAMIIGVKLCPVNGKC